MQVYSEQTVCDLTVVVKSAVRTQKLAVSGCLAIVLADQSHAKQRFSPNQTEKLSKKAHIFILITFVSYRS
jgi:hypothetical protein